MGFVEPWCARSYKIIYSAKKTTHQAWAVLYGLHGKAHSSGPTETRYVT